MNIIVNISDLKISDKEDDVIITYSLGSCLGASIYDPVNKTGGILHSMLPLSKIDKDKASQNPFMFVDTGLTSFLNKLFSNGSKKKDLIIKLAGCSRILDEKGLFNIGERNFTIARKILWKNDILIQAEDIGENKTRTMSLEMKTGKTFLKIQGVKTEL